MLRAEKWASTCRSRYSAGRHCEPLFRMRGLSASRRWPRRLAGSIPLIVVILLIRPVHDEGEMLCAGALCFVLCALCCRGLLLSWRRRQRRRRRRLRSSHGHAHAHPMACPRIPTLSLSSRNTRPCRFQYPRRPITRARRLPPLRWCETMERSPGLTTPNTAPRSTGSQWQACVCGWAVSFRARPRDSRRTAGARVNKEKLGPPLIQPMPTMLTMRRLTIDD
jgi:hypothetical protein